MTNNLNAFEPLKSGGITVSSGSTAGFSFNIGEGYKSIAISNLSYNTISYIRISSDSKAATTADFLVLPGSQVILKKNFNAQTVSYITPSGGGLLHIIAGQGYTNFNQKTYPLANLDLPFAAQKNTNDIVSGSNLITFSRASNATFVNSDGLIQTAGINVPRFDHNPVTKECLGLLVEEQRVNLLLNSENLSTQSIVVTSVAHSLSFYGSGTVVLSGAHSATVNGSGAYPARTVLVFTPTAGLLTLTITGTVQFANLEIGTFATSYIPTTTASATRNACLIKINTLSPWYNPTAGTLLAEGSRYNAGLTSGIMVGFAQNLTFSQSMYISNDAGFGNEVSVFVFNGGMQADMGGVVSSGVTNNFKVGFAYEANNFARSINGEAVVTNATGSVPAVQNLTIGSSPWNNAADNNWSGWIKRFVYYNQRVTNRELQLITL